MGCSALLPSRLTELQAAVHPPLVSLEERHALFEQCFSSVREPDTLAGWFFGAPVSALRRENVRDWILWAIFGADLQHREETRAKYGDEVERYVEQFEKIVGREFPEGRNENVKSLRVTLDPVLMLHRPLIWYMVRYWLFGCVMLL